MSFTATLVSDLWGQLKHVQSVPAHHIPEQYKNSLISEKPVPLRRHIGYDDKL